MTINFNKENLSSMVLRKALYWLDDECSWTMQETSSEWHIELLCDELQLKHYEGIVHQLVNDYALREQINLQTDDLKRAIIIKSLKDLSS